MIPDNIKEEIEKAAEEWRFNNLEALNIHCRLDEGLCQECKHVYETCKLSYIQAATQFYERGRISDETAKYWWDNYPKGLQCLLSPTEVVSANEYVKRENEAIKKEKKKIAKASFEAALAIETTMIRENWEHREHKFKNVQNYIDSDEFKKLLETPNDSEG